MVSYNSTAVIPLPIHYYKLSQRIGLGVSSPLVLLWIVQMACAWIIVLQRKREFLCLLSTFPQCPIISICIVLILQKIMQLVFKNISDSKYTDILFSPMRDFKNTIQKALVTLFIVICWDRKYDKKFVYEEFTVANLM